MGYLLKEVLKILCNSNQWSYAVFWKIGCQNPKLLIWEECHYEPSKSSLSPCVSGDNSTDILCGEWEKIWMSSETCPSQLGSQVGDRVLALVSKMMTRNQVNIMGEGIVGRAAFTGNHQWLLSNSFAMYTHPPEVLNELHSQFSAGMQTIAVVPVLPHGVVQFGSSLDISENIGFVNEVRRLVLQLGSVPGVFLSDSCSLNVSVEKIGVPVSAGLLVPVDPSGMHKMANTSDYMADIYNQPSNSSQPSNLVGQLPHPIVKEIQNNKETGLLPFEGSDSHQLPKSNGNARQAVASSWMKPTSAFGGHFKDGGSGAEVIPSNAWLNQQASLYNTRFGLNNNLCGFNQSQASQMSMVRNTLSGSSTLNHSVDRTSVSNEFRTSKLRTNGSTRLDHNLSTVGIPLLEGSQIHGGINGYSRPTSVPSFLSARHDGADPLTGIELRKSEAIKTEVVSCVADQSIVGLGFDGGQCSKDVNITRNGLARNGQKIDTELFQAFNIPLFDTDEQPPLNRHIPDFIRDCQDLDKKIPHSGSTNANLKNNCGRPSSGEDLFDIFGMDFRNKLLGGNELDGNTRDMHENTPALSCMKDLDSTFYSENKGISESSLFSDMGTDHLLDAVVSKANFGAKQSSEDNVSCRTTLTKNSNSSEPSSSLACGPIGLSKHVRGERFQLPGSLNKAGLVKSSSFKSGCSREDTGNCSQTTTLYGSQISSLVEQGHCMKRDNIVSTGYSKRPDEVGKSNRKRLKPGENPRPRPKDRQMIQDRVKELREIVPNGAKCSIDALLERTIKHMLFLQSVTKHADKLKHSGESKILNKEGGLLLKDNFEGGATWAFEVGSQSMVCPIIVEDLNTPRQMLVEMLCEERGFFLEIADLIRGMGLTILKGVMEARNNKIWARFAIEANRDVTRMEIFMSLVHLLEQTLKGGGGSSSATNSVDHSAVMAHDSFAQAAPITANR